MTYPKHPKHPKHPLPLQHLLSTRLPQSGLQRLLQRLSFGLSRLLVARLLPLGLAALLALPAAAQAPVAPDEKIRQLSMQILEQIRRDAALQAGDPRRINGFVDQTVMPHVNFERMTASAVGRGWRQATPAQQDQLMAEFRQLLIRTYSGALSMANDLQVRMRPMRGEAGGDEVVVRTEIVAGRGEPVQVDYRMERVGNDWRIFDVNVMGIWLVETYRSQFAQEVSARGIDGLIRSLAERNRQATQATRG
jgi:phospholipid transport system substrate-binding protein